MKLAVLTSGGDCAGMNAAVRAVVKAGILRGCETWIVREGYEGLVNGNTTGTAARKPSLNHTDGLREYEPADSANPMLQNLRFGDGELLRAGTSDEKDAYGQSLEGRYIVRVGWDDVRGWLAEGGTMIGTARSKAFREPAGREKAALNIIKTGIEGLVVIGGDGSLTGADKLRSEWPQLIEKLLEQGRITKEEAQEHSHLRIVGLVGSIDNDMAMTDMTIGASTALMRICEAIDNIHTTASSHSRAFVIEVMGRHCGWLALMAGLSAGADFIFIPEQPAEHGKWQRVLCNALDKHRSIGKRYSIVIVAEGAIDTHLEPITADLVKDVLTNKLSLDTRVTTLGHTQRGGKACAYDRILATLQGIEAVEALLSSEPSIPSYMIGMRENKITRVPLVEAVKQTQAVALAIEKREFGKAMALRDPEFAESYDAFAVTSSYPTVTTGAIAEAPSTSLDTHSSRRLTIAIVHCGAPAGGMNAATRTAVRFCISKGHTAIGVHNGFRDAWTTRGGSELGTNRDLPTIGLQEIADRCKEHQIDGILVIGGFEALTALRILESNQSRHKEFCIPLVHLPATISNNVPLTEFSIGSDTSLNSLVNACDTIKQSASASRNRVFVVETQGGQCGYIAVMGALATGAVLVYTPEDGMNLEMLLQDVKALKKRYALDVKGKSEGRIVIRSEKSSSIYSTDILTSILKEEGGAAFDARFASLGHTLQGGTPSPFDRARAVRLAAKCMAFIEDKAQAQPSGHQDQGNRSDLVSVITIQGTKVEFASVKDVMQHADESRRRAIDPWWNPYKSLAQQLGGLLQLQ